MLSRRIAPLLLALVLGGLAVSSPRLGRGATPAGNEATMTLAALSAAHDHDLRFETADLQRGNRLWSEGPVGIRLTSRPDESVLRFAVPVVVAIVSAPFAVAFGSAGLPVLNALLLAVLAWWASRLRPGSGMGAAFFLASGALALVFRAEAHVLCLALVFAALALALPEPEPAGTAQRWWTLALAGAFAGAALSLSLAAAWGGLVLAVDLVGQRKFRSVATLLAGALLTLIALAFAQHRLTGSWFPNAAPVQEWSGPFPGESGAGAGHPVAVEAWRLAARPSRAGRALFDRALGRHEGLVAFFPLAALALVVGWRGADRRRRLLLAALVAALAGGALGRGGASPVPAYAGFLPLLPLAFLALPERVGPRSVTLVAAALGLWTLPAIAAAWATPAGGAVASVSSLSTFQALPLELTALSDPEAQPELARLRWGDVVWLVPKSTFFPDEHHPHGIWVRGGSRSEIVLASPHPLDRLDLRLYSLASPNPVTLETPAGSVVVPFTSGSELSAGVDVSLALRPAAHDLGVVLAAPQPEWLYRVVLRVGEGTVLRRQRSRGDVRDLGVFLSVDGQPP